MANHDLTSKEAAFQHTVAAEVSCVGVSLHTGDMINMTIRPAAANAGIVFIRTDLEQHNVVPARFDAVVETTLGTTIANSHGVTVATIEHLMAALWGAGIDNARIELNGAEVPIMDGSSEPFIFLLDCAGRVQQKAHRKRIELLREVTVQEGASMATIAPQKGLSLAIEIAFNHALIATQKAVYDFTRTSFKQSLARARTFGFARDVEKMRSMGLALGGSLHNAIVLDEDRILNEGGLRYADEFVRHKALDCVGDYFLCGGQLTGAVTTQRPGHGINNKLLRAIFADSANYRIAGGEEADAPMTITREEMGQAVVA